MNSTTDSYPIFLLKKTKIIKLSCIRIYTQKRQINAGQGNKKKSDYRSYINM